MAADRSELRVEKQCILCTLLQRARDLMRPSQVTRKKTRVQFDLTMPRGK